METINFKSISNKEITVVYSGDNVIQIHEKYLRYSGQTTQEEQDETLGIKTKREFHWDEAALKKSINGVLVAWSATYEVYQLIIKHSDNDNWVIEYEEERFDEAIKVRDRILNWLLS